MKKSLIKLIKKSERVASTNRSETEFVDDHNRWSRAVRSWVTEFKQNALSESLPAFDSLFRATSGR